MLGLKYGNAHELIKDKNNSNEFALDFDSYIQKHMNPIKFLKVLSTN